MVKSALVTLIIGLATSKASAQGTMLFTWHGQSNYFQTSFILTDAEMQPGATFSSLEFTNSVHVDSLSGVSYHFQNGNTLIGGGVNPWNFEVIFIDFDHGTEMFIRSLSFPPGSMSGTMDEQTMSGQEIYFEPGYWTYSQIPEPSTISLIGAGLILWTLKKREGGARPLSLDRRD